MICTREDDHVRMLQYDRAQTVWVAELSSGLKVYQDDHRPGLSQHSAWVRLADHLAREGDRIIRLGLKFRSHKLFDILPVHADGYYFCRSTIGVFGLGTPLHFYMLGALTHGKVMIKRFKVPELTHIETVERLPGEVAAACLIQSSSTR